MTVQELSPEELPGVVEGNPVVVVDLWAPWCRPCVAFAPIFERASNNRDDITFVKIDTEAHPAAIEQFSISSIPTLLGYVDGELVLTKVGAVNGAGLAGLLDELVASR